MLPQGGLELRTTIGGDSGGNSKTGHPIGAATVSTVILGIGKMSSGQRVNLSIPVKIGVTMTGW